MKRYDVLLCDADNTIFDFDKAEANAFAATCESEGFAATPELIRIYSQINAALWLLLEKGGITQAQLRVRRFEQFLEAIGKPGDGKRMGDTFTTALGMQSVPLEGAVEAVRRWSGIVPVVIVTNGIASVQHGRMNASEIRRFIRGMVISEEVGAAKPDPKMLFMAMEKAGVTDKRRALMLGDSLSSDIAAAANAGIDACWFNPHGQINRCGLPVAYEIRALDEVDAILLGKEDGR